MENDTFCGGVETEGTEGDFNVNRLSLSSSAISDHWTLGLVAIAIRLGSTSNTETEGDGVFQESWLYTLADDIAVDITIEIAVNGAQEYSAGESSVGVNFAKKLQSYKIKIKIARIFLKKNLLLHNSSSWQGQS